MVFETRYGICWPSYGQFEVGWLQPLQRWLGAGTSSVAPVLVSQDRYLCHVQLHPTWFEPTSDCRSWPVVSYLYSGHLPVGLYLGRGSRLLFGSSTWNSDYFHKLIGHSCIINSTMFPNITATRTTTTGVTKKSATNYSETSWLAQS